MTNEKRDEILLEMYAAINNGLRNDVSYIKNNMVTKATCDAVQAGQRNLRKSRRFTIQSLLTILTFLGILILGVWTIYHERNAANAKYLQSTRVEAERDSGSGSALDRDGGTDRYSSEELLRMAKEPEERN